MHTAPILRVAFAVSVLLVSFAGEAFCQDSSIQEERDAAQEQLRQTLQRAFKVGNPWRTSEDPWAVWESMGEYSVVGSHCQVAAALGKAGETQEASKLLGALLDEQLRIVGGGGLQGWACVQIGTGFASLGRAEDSQRAFAHALKASRSLENQFVKCGWLERIGEAALRAGHKELGMKAVNESLELTAKLKNPLAKLDGLTRIARTMAATKEGPRAAKLLRDATTEDKLPSIAKENAVSVVMHDYRRLSVVLANAAQVLASVGEKERAVFISRLALKARNWDRTAPILPRDLSQLLSPADSSANELPQSSILGR